MRKEKDKNSARNPKKILEFLCETCKKLGQILFEMRFSIVLGLLWGLGLGIFAWLATGIACQRSYVDLKCAKQDWPPGQDVYISLLFLIFPLLVFFIFRMFVTVFLFLRRKICKNKEMRNESSVQENQSALRKILVTVAPILFLILSVAVLTVTFAAYNDPWNGNYSGLITGFGALFASVGALATVSVTYKSGEENRKAQKEIEDEKRERDERKHDAELIKDLNDRLREILPGRHSKELVERVSSYYQLVSLYEDWGILSRSSELISIRMDSNREEILRILFGPALNEGSCGEYKDVFLRNSTENHLFEAMVSSLFDEVAEDGMGRGQAGFECYHKEYSFRNLRLNFESLNFSGIKYLRRDMRGIRFVRSDLSGANFYCSDLAGSNFRDVTFRGSNLKKVNLSCCKMDGVDLGNTQLEGAIFFPSLGDRGSRESRQLVINQLKTAKVLPDCEEIIKADGFDKKLVDEILEAHKEYWAEKAKKQEEGGTN